MLSLVSLYHITKCFSHQYVSIQLRRLELKSERSTETRSAEVREGDTYNPNIMGVYLLCCLQCKVDT